MELTALALKFFFMTGIISALILSFHGSFFALFMRRRQEEDDAGVYEPHGGLWQKPIKTPLVLNRRHYSEDRYDDNREKPLWLLYCATTR